VVMQDEVVGHAVRAVYMYAGMTDIAAIYRDADYLNAVNNLWKNMVNKKMYITGGIGARHEGESFGDNYELPNISAYSETCAAIGSVYWNHRLFLLTGKSKYYDVIERTLYNALIAGISVDGNNFFYPNPLESDGKYTFNMGSCTRQHWFDCSCCPTNLIRFIPSVPGLVYAVNKDSLYINLYMSNNAKIMVENTSVNVNQETNYPWQGNIKINISPEKKKIFTIKLRIPGWAQNIAVPGDLYYYLNNDEYKIEVKVNGEEYFKSIQDGYIEITKKWNIKDEIEITFPFYVKQVIANEKVEEVANQVAIEYGPFVYCAEEIDNFEKLSQVIIPDKIQYAIEKKTIISNPINFVKCMVYTRASDTEMKETQLNLIPYYLWSNRGVGEMSVWFKRD
ncbi:MAG: glycoside hydrolase family 127 protein, partial [Bacteroidales bacterium]|nr:glycoside hydrolase family 127 protein [Bacteroidales bacterium]